MEQIIPKLDDHIMKSERGAESTEKIFSIEKVDVPVPFISKFYHFHEFYELYYLYSGERYYFIKDKTYHVKSGTLVLVNPHDIHCTSNSAKYGYKRHLIYFNKEYLQDFLDLEGEYNLLKCFYDKTRIIKLDIHGQHFVETLLKSMSYEYENNNEGRELYIKSAMVQLLIFMNRNNSKLQDGDVDVNHFNSYHKTIAEITAYINDNYHEDLSLSSISKKFFISSYHLSRTFKASTGFSFVDYLNGIRIKEAQTLLRKTDKSIADIAERVGYNSATHFGRVFKNITGTTPLLYKKLQRKNNRE